MSFRYFTDGLEIGHGLANRWTTDESRWITHCYMGLRWIELGCRWIIDGPQMSHKWTAYGSQMSHTLVTEYFLSSPNWPISDPVTTLPHSEYEKWMEFSTNQKKVTQLYLLLHFCDVSQVDFLCIRQACNLWCDTEMLRKFCQKVVNNSRICLKEHITNL